MIKITTNHAAIFTWSNYGHAGYLFLIAAALTVILAISFWSGDVAAGASFSSSPAESVNRIKVCKIAGPGIPVNTRFRFTVTGTGALSALPPDQTTYGPVTRTVDVRAGDPAQGGTCEFVPGFGANAPGYNQFQTFVNGTTVTIVENGISPENTEPQNPGELRTSNIRQFGSAFASPDVAGFSPNPDLSPTLEHISRAAVVAAGEAVEIEFASFRFNPTVLKVCKIAGTPSILGTSFDFTVALVSPTIGGSNPGNMFPSFSQTVTVSAGLASQGGNCTFVNGAGLLGGAFNQGSTITVTESAAATYVTAITCPTCGDGGVLADLPGRKGTLKGPNGVQAGVNAITFTNEICPIFAGTRESEGARPQCSPDRASRYDFDGDRKADPAVFDPSTGEWTFASSANDNAVIGPRGFGIVKDKLVPEDYDGDSKTDLAVFRPSTGYWYFQGSTQVFEAHHWGQAGDVPLAGDYDGDGKADFAVWRPSDATVYIKHSNQTFRIFTFGVSSDRPMAADFDGDGRTDIAMFRDGTWYLQNSSTGFRVYNFGRSGDIPVPADYDGDDAADIGIYRAGTWYTLSATTYSSREHGRASDIPVPADYDGDGKADLAYFSAARGSWSIRRSTDGLITRLGLGGPGDIPLQSPQYLLNGE